MEKILERIDQLKWLDAIFVEPELIWVLVALAAMVEDAKSMCLVVEPTGHHCNYPGCIDYGVHSVNTIFEVFVAVKGLSLFLRDNSIILPSEVHNRRFSRVLVVRVVEAEVLALATLYPQAQY